MEKSIEAQNLPLDEKVYLKKDIFGWRIVEPWTDEDGNFIWFNFMFGSKRNLMFLIFMFALIGLFYVGVEDLISNYQEVAENPCAFCSTCHQYVGDFLAEINKESGRKFALNITQGMDALINSTKGGDIGLR